MTTNIIKLNSHLPSWIDPDPEVVRRENADLNAEYLDSWINEGKRYNQKALSPLASKCERELTAKHLMQRMADEILREAIRHLNQQSKIKSRLRYLVKEDDYLMEFDCAVASVPYWLVRGIGYRLRPAIELLTLLSDNHAIKAEFESWLTVFMLEAEKIKKEHISLGRGFTRTHNVSHMILPLIYSIRDELRRIVALAEKDEKLAGLFCDYEYFINRAFDTLDINNINNALSC